MKYLALLAVLPLIGACDVQAKDGNEGDAVTISGDDSGHVAFNLPFMEGRVKLPAGKLKDGNFQIEGVKLMPGTSMTGFSVDARDKGSTVNFGFKVPSPPNQVRSYYVDKFREQGVEASLSGDTVSGRTKDGDPFTIQVTPAPDGSEGRITIQSDD